MTSAYTCRVCNHQLDPASSNTVRKVTAWLRGSSKTIYRITDEHYEYVHDFCTDHNKKAQDSLFDD